MGLPRRSSGRSPRAGAGRVRTPARCRRSTGAGAKCRDCWRTRRWGCRRPPTMKRRTTSRRSRSKRWRSRRSPSAPAGSARRLAAVSPFSSATCSGIRCYRPRCRSIPGSATTSVRRTRPRRLPISTSPIDGPGAWLEVRYRISAVDSSRGSRPSAANRPRSTRRSSFVRPSKAAPLWSRIRSVEFSGSSFKVASRGFRSIKSSKRTPSP